MSAVSRLVSNEMEKTWRSRWVVFAVVFGLFVLIAGGLYGYYVYRAHRWTPPPPVAWQTQLQQQLDSDRVQLRQLEQQRQSQESSPGGRGNSFGARALDSAITQIQQSIKNDQYLLDNDIAPLQAYSITRAALFALGGIIMFLLTRIFGWLAAEQVAGERSDRTITILLSRPATRDQVLLSKALASFIFGLAAVIITFLIVYLVFGFLFGSLGPVTGQVGIALDGSQPLGPDNLITMSIPVFVLMCLGAAMLAIVCVQGMSLLVSVVSGRWAAIGITLAVLFAAPVVSGIVSGILGLITGDSQSAHFLDWIFFNVLAPVGAIAPSFGSGPTTAGTGMTEFEHQVITLAAWTVAFYLGAWALFHRRQEAG